MKTDTKPPKDKNPKKIEKKPELSSTLNVAVNKISKESDRPKGSLDKLKRPLRPENLTQKTITSAIVFRQHCARLTNKLHQQQQHTVAIRVAELTKLIKDNMPQPAKTKLLENLVEISRQHGIDFLKP